MSDDDALKQETGALQQMTEAESKLLVGLAPAGLPSPTTRSGSRSFRGPRD
ncbi:hypothetical protein ABIF90_003177 [Bradyrhizobium japonicum]